jgi:cold shock CspA family protein
MPMRVSAFYGWSVLFRHTGREQNGFKSLKEGQKVSFKIAGTADVVDVKIIESAKSK